jgi:hypothetical protein
VAVIALLSQLNTNWDIEKARNIYSVEKDVTEAFDRLVKAQFARNHGHEADVPSEVVHLNSIVHAAAHLEPKHVLDSADWNGMMKPICDGFRPRCYKVENLIMDNVAAACGDKLPLDEQTCHQ